MAESETNHRTVVLGVDASEHSERAFDCKLAFYIVDSGNVIISECVCFFLPQYSLFL